MVIDTSVAAKWFVREDGHERAAAILDYDGPIVAPALLLPELANVLFRKVILGQVTREQAEASLAAAPRLLHTVMPMEGLIDHAFLLALELNHPVYDCVFLAAALPAGSLVTADERFAARCDDCGYDQFVASLEHFSLAALDPQVASEAIAEDLFQEIERLALVIDAAREALMREVSVPGPGGYPVVSGDVPILRTPVLARERLKKLIAPLPTDQLQILVALGFLGRPEYDLKDWPRLHRSARTIAAEGLGRHEAYALAQIEAAPAGLAKLRAARASSS